MTPELPLDEGAYQQAMNPKHSLCRTRQTTHAPPASRPARPSRHPLVRKLGWVIVVKLLMLMLIWWSFMADQSVEVDAEQAASHLLLRSPPDSNKE